eukprot:gnl/TRDRNA2_/TRDRNA2_40115_c0_seq1.p1 gnl/TRDRNA2_/TRDRNA2_40115_c0~~gnl/TRDRNA2_/TRDRNA2_40115_c0_seq1.p1  ORF type:complete len:892 (-),score=196.87 gnl/TRDRNA2_/TRDRNA2_40115_c0_seq1:73-2748(-)
MAPKLRLAKGGGKGASTTAVGSPAGKRPSTKTAAETAERDDVIAKLFELADVRADGVLQFHEFLDFRRTLMAMEECPALDHESDRDIEKNFRDWDKDNSLTLDRVEFVSYMQTVCGILGNRLFLQAGNMLVQEETSRRSEQRHAFDHEKSQSLFEKVKMAYNFSADLREKAEALLEKKADPNWQEPVSGSNVLMYAAEKADDVFIARLLAAGADIMLHNKEADCAVFRAARARNMSVLAVFLQPSRALVSGEQQARLLASQKLVRGIKELEGSNIRELLSQRADINYKDNNGWTPLTAAVFWNRRSCVEALLERGQHCVGAARLRLDGTNSRGRPALHIAARKGFDDLIPLLTKGLADPNMQDNDGWTPLHHAAFNNMGAAVISLVGAGASVTIQGRNGLTPLMAASLSSGQQQLGEKAMKLLEPMPSISFGKILAPLLNDTSTTPYAKLQALMDLNGVHYMSKNLRLYEQFFPSMTAGPNKVRLQKVWESVASHLLRRLRSGECDLNPLDANASESAREQRLQEIEERRQLQKQFIAQWLLDTKGPRPTQDWPHDNRAAYAEVLKAVLAEELADFQKELDALYERMCDESDGGAELAEMPAEEVLRPRYLSQAGAHPIPVWLELRDPRGTFEALRSVAAAGMGRDDDESVMCFVDLLCNGHDFNTGASFWANVYRLWLWRYSLVANDGFHKQVSAIVAKFNEAYNGQGLKATYKQVPVKTYERIKIKERQFGVASPDTFVGRTIAAKILDIVRGSITVNSPKAAVILLNEFLRPLTSEANKLELAYIKNSYSAKAESSIDSPPRRIEVNLFWNGGLQASPCGRQNVSLPVAIVGEVQIVLEEFLAVRKRRHLLYKCWRGDFDWSEEDRQQAMKDGSGEAAARASLYVSSA